MISRERQTTPTALDEVRIPVDPVNEQIVLAGMLVHQPTRKAMCSRLIGDYFQAKEHRPIFLAMQELERRKLSFDAGILKTLAKGVDVEYVSQLIESRPTLSPNFEHCVKELLWDYARSSTVTGPLNSFIEAVRDQRSERDRVCALAKQIYETISTTNEFKYLRDPAQLVAEQAAQIDSRLRGTGIYCYGIEHLDFYENYGPNGERVRRLSLGPAPGATTMVTAVSGSGKSTLVLNMALGLVREGRRPVICAWEMKSGDCLEIMACMVLGWDRSLMREGKSSCFRGELLSEDERIRFNLTMQKIADRVRFIDNPFNRSKGEKGGRNSNDRNLDILQSYLEASGCDVFFADLWKRALRDISPEEEEQALIRQQAMAEELRMHAVLVQQQRLKDVEQREDKRPTREGIKGSAAWVEVADTILAVHRPGLWGDFDDSILEIDVLKQRQGRWPMAVQFKWDANSGRIGEGITVPYEQAKASKKGVSEFFKGK